MNPEKQSSEKVQNMMKSVYFFGQGQADGGAHQKDLLGGKGANLHEMTRLGLPVPPGFTISTDVCRHFFSNGRQYPDGLRQQVLDALHKIESLMGVEFGNPQRPLLLSIRSGARASMPGMMDTILNLGLNDDVVEGMVKISGDARFAYDSYRRFLCMYSDVVLGLDKAFFEEALERKKDLRGVHLDTELSADDMKSLIKEYKSLVLEQTGKSFPMDPQEQLWGAISAVFLSWMNTRAVTYRRLNQIPEEWGTAVNVQAMVFGNMGNDCATGVAFTRDPSTGRRQFFGEFLVNAQGEDVVAGIRTPHPINHESKNDANRDFETLQGLMPEVYADLERIYKKLEAHYKDMQDIEFTIQKNRLYMLQCRIGKRTAFAALRIAVDMVQEGLIDKKTAIMRVKPNQLDQLMHPHLDSKAEKTLIAKGLPASPGAACGQIVFDADTAEKWAHELGRKVILVRAETSPEDIHGMNVAEGILTARGGMTSHAAVVARGMGRPCIAGCSAVKISGEKVQIGLQSLSQGDFITLDGATGDVYLGQVPTISPGQNALFREFMSWVDEFRSMGVRANSDTPRDARVALEFGAEGIGLCRTEHMFFELDRIDAVREMILAEHREDRVKALEKILPMQRQDFVEIFKVMKGKPVTIRLLDPPLHEFLPQNDLEMKTVAEKLRVPLEQLKHRVVDLHEFNPMLGHRGCRLGISFPEIYKTQVRAILEAALYLAKTEGWMPEPEIMIPLVGDARELKFLRGELETEAQRLFSEQSLKVPFKIGTMIELPRAALTADEIAVYAEFFSFGTNDLTQTTLGWSRDDSGPFLQDYLARKIFDVDPFTQLDRSGVGELIKIATKKGRSLKPDLKIGICGEHGGDPSSIEFCEGIGLDYVSCSPYRVPVARLAAAQAAVSRERTKV